MTASQVTGVAAEAEELAERWEAVAESMEGAAAAHVCALYGMPFLEVRGISNLVGDRDRAPWQVRRAVAAATWAARAIVERLDNLPLAESGAAAGGEALTWNLSVWPIRPVPTTRSSSTPGSQALLPDAPPVDGAA